MNFKRLLLAFLFLVPSLDAGATISASYPYNLQNGQTADATQVMSNFDQIQNDVNSNAAHNGANIDITSLTGLSTPLGIAFGGTGSATASGARSGLGLGASAVENLGAAIIDDGSGNLTIGVGAITGTMVSSSAALPNGVTATTQAADTNNTKLATTQFVIGQGASKATMQTATSTTEFPTAATTQNHPGVAKAAVNFTVSGTTVTVQSSYNVASVVRNSAGLYTINFTTPFADTHYMPSGIAGPNTAGNAFIYASFPLSPIKTVSSFRIQYVNNNNSTDDPADASLIFYGTQ